MDGFLAMNALPGLAPNDGAFCYLLGLSLGIYALVGISIKMLRLRIAPLLAVIK